MQIIKLKTDRAWPIMMIVLLSAQAATATISDTVAVDASERTQATAPLEDHAESSDAPSTALLVTAAAGSGGAMGIAAGTTFVGMMAVGAVAWLSNASSAAPIEVPAIAEPLFALFFFSVGLPSMAMFPGFVTGLIVAMLDGAPIAAATTAIATSLVTVGALTFASLITPVVMLLAFAPRPFGLGLIRLNVSDPMVPAMLGAGAFISTTALVGLSVGVASAAGTYTGQGIDHLLSPAFSE